MRIDDFRDETPDVRTLSLQFVGADEGSVQLYEDGHLRSTRVCDLTEQAVAGRV